MEQAASTSDKPLPCWPGVLLSIFVPGFGLIRAGHARRGLLWLAGMLLYGVFATWLSVWDRLPLWAGAVALGSVLVVAVWMWIDSFRPGRMTARLWWLFAFACALIGSLPAPALLVGKTFSVPTGGMEPTLIGPRSGKTPDYIVVDRLAYKIAQPKRGDVIVFRTSLIRSIAMLELPSEGKTRETYYTKRLVGLPGERIKIVDGKLYADDRALGPEDGIPPVRYTAPPRNLRSKEAGVTEFVVGVGEYFVLGDNSEFSSDSRYWGNVPAAALYGKVTGIFFPFDRFGRLKHPAKDTGGAAARASTSH